MTDTISLATARSGKPRRPTRRHTAALLRGMIRSRNGMIGGLLALVPILIAVIGPFLTPVDPASIVGAPFSAPGAGYPLGTDYLGRDVLSRVLDGGWWILALSVLATAIGVGLGSLLGLIAGYRRGATGQVIMRLLDVLLSFPPILLALLFMSIIGPEWWLVMLTVAASHVGPVARVVESATLGLVNRGFIQYGEMIGMSRLRLLTRDLLPNMVAPLTVQVGIRLSYSVGFIGALAYLGYGRPSPQADWGSMIAENQINIIAAPMPVVVPVLALALLTVGINLLTDAFGRAAGIDIGKDNA